VISQSNTRRLLQRGEKGSQGDHCTEQEMKKETGVSVFSMVCVLVTCFAQKRASEEKKKVTSACVSQIMAEAAMYVYVLIACEHILVFK
jgi:hypothetical protein